MNEQLCKEVSDINVVQTNMERFGGSFAKALAKALFYADLDNARKIKATWPELWDTYLKWGIKGAA